MPIDIVRNSILVSVITVFNAGLGFIAQLLIAKTYGAGLEIDAYLFTLSIPIFISAIIASLYSYTIVPRLVHLEDNPKEYSEFIHILIKRVLILALVIILGGMLVGKGHQRLFATESIRNFQGLDSLALVSWAIAACQIVQGALVAILNGMRRHLTAAWLSAFPAIGMIVAVAVNDVMVSEADIFWVPFGMLIGIIISVTLAAHILRDKIIPSSFSEVASGYKKKEVEGVVYSVLGMSCFSWWMVIDAIQAPKVGDGMLASMGYAQRLIVGVGSLVIAGPSAVLVPRFSAMIRDGDKRGFMKFLFKSLLAVGVPIIGLALIISIFSEELITVLFMRGSFGANDVANVSILLSLMAPGMAAMVISVLLLRMAFAFEEGDKKGIAVLGIAWGVSYYCISAIISDRSAEALPIAYSVTWIAYLLFVLGYVMNKAKHIK